MGAASQLEIKRKIIRKIKLKIIQPNEVDMIYNFKKERLWMLFKNTTKSWSHCVRLLA